MHINEQDEVALATQQWRRQKSRCVGGLWEFMVISFMMAEHIYRGDPPRVIMSHNQLGLSVKHITCKGLGQISLNHSHACHVLAPFSLPHHVGPDLARASAHMCLFHSPLLHILASAKRATHYLSRLHSSSNSNVGLKSCLLPCTNVPLDLLGIPYGPSTII
jgi:hypothetical protein